MRKRVRRLVALAAVAGVSVIPAISVSETAKAADWFPIGGPYGSDPMVLPKSNIVFAVGQTGDPYYHEGSNGWGASQLGGQLDSVIAPAEALIGSQPSNFEIFGIGLDSAVWYRTRSSGWQSFGGAFISSPTAVIWNGVTYVFGIGLDEAIWYRSTTSEWFTLGGRITSDLAVTTDGTNLYVLGVGGDGSLWSQRLTGLSWSGWENLGGTLDSFPATTYSSSANAGYVFAIGTDGGVWYRGVSGGVWSGWFGLGGQAESAPTAVARGATLDVFVVGTDLAMYAQRWTGSAWTGWRAEGGGFDSNPAASLTHEFGLGLDGRLYVAPIP